MVHRSMRASIMRGLVDVRGRLEKVKKGKEGRGRLVGVLTDGDEGLNRESSQARAAAQTAEESSEVGPSAPAKDDDEQVVMVELDRRCRRARGPRRVVKYRLGRSTPYYFYCYFF